MAQLSSSIRRLPQFATTSWTVIVDAAGDGVSAQHALESLCQDYWYPIYAFVRRTGLRAADAEDATQAFFAWLIESGVVSRADRERGRFRTFLIASVKQFLSRRREYENAAKRRPEQPLVKLNVIVGEERYEFEPCDHQTPERMFEYSWALTIIETAMLRVHAEWIVAGRGQYFDVLKQSILGLSDLRGRELSQQLGMSEGAVRVAVHRLKRRFAEVLREEVSRTLEEHESVDEELQLLLGALQL